MKSLLSYISNEEKLSDIFHLGDIIQTRIISSSQSKKRLILRLVIGQQVVANNNNEVNNNNNANNTSLSSSSQLTTELNQLQAGQYLNGAILKDLKKDKKGQAYYEIELSSIINKQIQIILPLSHVTDHIHHIHSLQQYYEYKKQHDGLVTLDNLLILSHIYYANLNVYKIIVSHKESLRIALHYDQILLQFKQAYIGGIYHGYIKSITDYGIFIGFLNNLVALIPNQYLENFSIGQSMVIQIISINYDEEKNFM